MSHLVIWSSGHRVTGSSSHPPTARRLVRRSLFSKTQAEHAESIAGFIERSTHEAMRRQKNPTLLRMAIEGLSASVKGFEVSHPQLVENVNYIANALANMGI